MGGDESETCWCVAYKTYLIGALSDGLWRSEDSACKAETEKRNACLERLIEAWLKTAMFRRQSCRLAARDLVDLIVSPDCVARGSIWHLVCFDDAVLVTLLSAYLCLAIHPYRPAHHLKSVLQDCVPYRSTPVLTVSGPRSDLSVLRAGRYQLSEYDIVTGNAWRSVLCKEGWPSGYGA